jgi:TetR/AcrR family transcriptional repressor of mexJK operon
MAVVTGVPSQAKRQAILEAATEAFLHSGYAASVDEIAAAAGVGKQTVYRHFGDKQALFLAAVAAARATTASAPDGAHSTGAPSTGAPSMGDPLGGLTDLGERILAVALSPTVAALHRLTIAEIGNHPELSAHWSDGADPFIDDQLADHLRRYDEAGLLSVPDPARSARQFAYLLITEGRMATAYGIRHLAPERRQAIAAETADLIVRAHRPS